MPGGALYHDGCALDFGPDGKLYVSTGDARLEELAQDVESLAGKILRRNADGTIPENNPFPGSPVWSYGHRNSQGLAWQPGTNHLFSTEHGIDGVNELNVIKPGGNFGWPTEREGAQHPLFKGPLLKHDGPPAAALFITGNRYPSMHGDLLFTTLGTPDLRQVTLDDSSPVQVANVRRHLVEKLGRLRALTQGPDGYLYVATSNHDGRGNPASGDDRIFRLLPAKQ